MSVERHIPDLLRSKYAIKLFGISLLIVAIVLALGTVTAVKVSERVTENQLQSIEANAELEANALGRWMEGEQQTLRILSKGIDTANLTATRATLNGEFTSQSEDLDAFHVVERASSPTSNGTTERIVASTDSGLEGSQLAATNINWGEDTDGNDRQFTFESQDDLLTSWVYIDDSEPLVAMATPTADGKHVLIGEYRPSVRVQQSVDVVEGTDTVVLGGVSGWVIFDETSPDEFRRYKGQVNKTEVGSRILARDDPTSVLNGSEVDTDEVRGYHSVPVSGIDWVVVKETPRSTALSLPQQVQTDLSMLIGIIVVGFMLIGVVIERGPIQSIKRTADKANAIAEGDLSVNITRTNRIDEIGKLNESFWNTKEYIDVIAQQSEALSRQEFDADVLDRTVPGRVGESMASMRTDLERFIDELEAERERYSTLIEQSNDGIVVVQDGRFVFTNDRFVEISGYDRDQLLGMEMVDLIVPEDREFAREQYDRRMSGESPSRTYELGIETDSGEQRTVAVSASYISHDGEPASLVNVRDITDRKRRENRLTVFHRVLRHNLRNSLQPVQGVLNTIESDTIDQSFVDTAQRQVDELLSTADTARYLEQAFRDLEMIRADLGPMFGSLQERAQTDYPDATMELPDGTATVEVAHVLQDALWELLENAFEYTGEHPHVELTLDVQEDVAVLRISDDGDGIPKVERETLGRNDETALQHTSGLGLWFTHWTIQASGGTLDFEVDGGTTVIVTLPLADDSDKQP